MAIEIPCKRPEDLPEIPFCMGVFGPSRSGKSTFLEALFRQKNLFKNVFRPQDIFIICPSLEFNLDDYKDVCVPKNRFFEFSNSLINEILAEQQLCIKTYKLKKTPNILILMDDVFDNCHFHNSAALKTIGFRGRHMKISVICSGQQATSCSRSIRLNLTNLIWFMPSNFSELDFIAYENCEKSRRKELGTIIKNIWKADKYEFIHFDKLNKDSTLKIRKGLSGDIGYDALDKSLSEIR